MSMTIEDTSLAPVTPSSVPMHVANEEPSIGYILARAVDKGMDPAGIEKLAAIYEREMARRAKQSFIDSLKAFRGECPPLVKNRDATNPKNNAVMYSYIDLSEVTKIVDPVLVKNGFTYTWDTDTTGDVVVVTCTLSHVDGHEKTSKFTGRAGGTSMMSDVQKSASAVTFGRRYTLTGVLGMTIDDDNDGRRMGTPNKPPEPEPNAPKVGTRAERAAQQAPVGAPQVTANDLRGLYKHWCERAAGPHSIALFSEWVVKTMRLDRQPADMTNTSSWTIDLVASVEDMINGL